jgi:hypothetical protein
MELRLTLFTLRKRRISHRLIALLAVVIVVTGMYSFWQRSQQAELELRFPEAAYVSAVEIDGENGFVANAMVSPMHDTVIFRLPTGTYTIKAVPSSAGYQQHWALTPLTVHLSGRRVIRIWGVYGGE